MLKDIVEKGDIIYIDCTPQAGHEQKGRRPVLVVSNNIYNEKVRNMAMICPITNTNRNSPFHVKISSEYCKTSGFVMAEQAKVLDISARNAEPYDKATDDIVEEVVEIIREIIE